MPHHRIKVLKWALYMVMGLIVLKLIYLQVIKHDFFVEKSKGQIKKVIKIRSHRGSIYDRHKNPLAFSIKAYSMYAMPPKIPDKMHTAKTLAPILHEPWQEIYHKINTDYPFVWLKRKASEEIYNAILNTKIKGLNGIQEEKRLYPNNTLAADVLGFVGTDGGLGGLEYQYESFLTGSSGKLIIEGDPRGGQLITGSTIVRGIPKGYKKGVKRIEAASFDGGHIHTTIDSYIQFIAQKYLEKGILNMEAKSGQVIVMDPKTGDILAMADYPFFNPNTFWTAPDNIRKNSCIVDVFEPGSVLKVIPISAVLEEKIATPGTLILVPETYTLAGRTIKEAHKREPEDPDQYSIGDILVKSLNVGTTLLAMELGEESLYTYLKKYRLGERHKIGLPGESAGLVRPVSKWSKVDIGMISFGQGIGVTTLQLATMMSTLANKGVFVKPRLIKYVTDHEGVSIKATPKQYSHRVVSEKTARNVLTMMTQTVNHGTGIIVRQKGFSIAGKTGTAQKAGPGGIGYLEDEYVASFMGTFPSYDPQIVIVVNIHSPKKKIWGSSVAGPVFKHIAKDLIDYYNIPPDDLVYNKEKR